MSFIDYHKYTFLPVYDSVEKQYWRKQRRYSNWHSDIRLHPKNAMIPIQLQRSMSAATLTYITMKRPDFTDVTSTTGTTILEVLPLINATDILYRTKEGWDDILILGNKELTSDLTKGSYYYEIKDGTNTWYTELFNVCSIDLTFQNNFIINTDGGGGQVVKPTVSIGGVQVLFNI